MTKICSKCNKELPIEDFPKDKSRKDGFSYICKNCKSKYQQRFRYEHKEILMAKMKEYKKRLAIKREGDKKAIHCFICGKLFIPYSSIYKCCSKKCSELNIKEHRKKNDIEKYQERLKYNKEYYQRNKNQRLEYERTKRKKNINFRLRHVLKSRISTALRQSINKKFIKIEKTQKTLNLVGCNLTDLKQHLEKQFQKGMSWDNYGSEWHIDHIWPISIFDLRDPQQQRACFHYTNLQPLWAKENIRKKDKLPINFN